MKYYKKDESFIVILKKGEELIESLKIFLEKSQMQNAWINGLGACMEVELGFYNLDEKKYHWKKFKKTLEITGLTGNITRDLNGAPLFHIHGSFADSGHKVIGGHVNKLITGGTCELNLTPINGRLTREFDDETGLKLIKEISP